MSKIKKNIFANYFGVIVTTALSFLVVPFYLKLLGQDAFGLVGIASLIQGWVMLLNSGLAPVTGREAAKAYSGGGDWKIAASFFRTVDIFLISLSCIVAIIFVIISKPLSLMWIKSNTLDTSTIALALCLLVIMTLFRLLTSVTRGILINVDMQVWLNNNLIIFSMLRFAASIPLLHFYPSVNFLFAWWLIISIVEYVITQQKVWGLVPVKLTLFTFNSNLLKEQWRIIAALASTSLIWVLISNMDKLILSTYLTLENYGFYSISTLLSSGIIILAQPIAQAFQPRMTSSFSVDGIIKAEKILENATRWVVCLIFPVAMILCFYPLQVIYIWTGNLDASSQAGNLLPGYTFGNIFIALGSLLYAFQVSVGVVRKHLQGNILLCAIYLPLLPIVVTKYGALGVSMLWAMINISYFIFWNLHLLNKITLTLYPKWIFRDCLLPLLFNITIAYIVQSSFPLSVFDSRIKLVAELFFLSSLFFILNFVYIRLIQSRFS